MNLKSKYSLLPTLAGLLTLTLAACQNPANSLPLSSTEQQPQQTTTKSQPESASLPTPDSLPAKPATTPQENEVATSSAPIKENNQLPCVTWNEYQATQPSSDGLQMPPGFENGCVFRVGQTRGTNIEILHNDINLDTIIEPGAIPFNDDPLPWFQGNQVNNQYDEQRKNGNIIAYYQGCVTIGGQESNCNGFPQNEAYIVNDHTACFQGRCLRVPTVHAIYLLSLWPWNDEIHDLPTSFSRNGTLARKQYRTIPLNQLPPGIPLFSRSREDVARAAYGRTTLEEGEQPTVITDVGPSVEYGVDVVFLTNQGSADDSIGGYRYRLDFVGADAEQSKLIWVGQQHYCRRGEHTGWTAKTCS